MKDRKVVILAAVSAVIVIALILIFMPSGKKSGDEGTEVISMRATVGEESIATEAPQTPVEPLAPPQGTALPEAAQSVAPTPPLQMPLPAVEPVKEAVQEVQKEAPPAKKAEKVRVPEKTKKAAKAVAMTPGEKPWAINVASFASLPEAQGLAGSLKKAGHKAYIADFTKDSVKWYRVRVGFFKTREEALKTGKGISSKFRVDSPWVVKPDMSELKAHS